MLTESALTDDDVFQKLQQRLSAGILPLHAILRRTTDEEALNRMKVIMEELSFKAGDRPCVMPARIMPPSLEKRS